MFIIAFVIVVLYQFYKKKKDNVDENDGDLVKKFGQNKNLSTKAKNDLNEIEKMMSELGNLGEGIKSMGKGMGKR